MCSPKAIPKLHRGWTEQIPFRALPRPRRFCEGTSGGQKVWAFPLPRSAQCCGQFRAQQQSNLIQNHDFGRTKKLKIE